MTKFQARTVRRWSLVHKWTSLIATIFLLVLCGTGLPLVFHQEIDNYLNPPSSMPAMPPGTQATTLDTIVAEALKRHPGDVPVSLGFFRDRPAVVVQSAPTPRTPFNLSHRETIDLRTGQLIDLPPEARGKLTTFLRELHTNLFLGLPGALFLGVMALMLIVAVVSGIVVYAPFMRRLDFGAIRAGGGRRLVWLDLHNLLGDRHGDVAAGRGINRRH